MSNNPMDYFRQLEQIGDQLRTMFNGNDFMRNFMPNMQDMMGQGTSGNAASTPFQNGFDWVKGGAYPRVDLYQTSREVIALVEVPGLEKSSDVSISVDATRLYIRGSHSHRLVNVAQENIIMTERHSGVFERELTLPVRVHPKDVKASYKNGLLEIRMLKDDQSHQGTRGHIVPIQF